MVRKQLSGRLLKKRICFSAAVIVMIAVWWISAETYFARSGVIPPPPQVLGEMGRAAASGLLWHNVWNTLWKVFAAFFISFVMGLGIAIPAAKSESIVLFVTPFITVARALPTIGVILVLFRLVRSPDAAAIAIGVMMVFPMLYEGFFTALKEVDRQLLQMARIMKIPLHKQLCGIYAPHIAPFVFGGSLAAMGMALKVIVAAEIMSIPVRNTLGTAMSWANQSMERGLLFMWLVVTVLVSFALEFVIKSIGKACMPWKKRQGGA